MAGLRGIALGAFVALVATAPAHGALLDADTRTISRAGGGSPLVAVTPSGWTLVVWSTLDREVRGSWRPPGGRFGPERRIASGKLISGQLAATADDRVVVAWMTSDAPPYHGTGKAMLLRPGAVRGPSVTLTGPTLVWGPIVAADAHGGAVLVASDEQGLLAVDRRGDGFAAPQRLMTGMALYPDVRSNAAGDVAVVYSTEPPGLSSSPPSPVGTFYIGRPAGASAFRAPEQVPIGLVIAPALAVTERGDVAVAGVPDRPVAPLVPPTETPGTNLAYRPREGGFSVQSLNAIGSFGGFIPSAGNRLTILDSERLHAPLRSRERNSDGTLGAPTEITGPATCYLAPVVTPANDTVVAFTQNCQKGHYTASIAVIERPAGGAFSPPLKISPDHSAVPVAAVNPSGALAMAWTRVPSPKDKDRTYVQAVARDAKAELGLLAPKVSISVTGVLDLELACTGLIDCNGRIEVLPAARMARAAASRPLARRAVHLRRGRSRHVRVRVSRSLRRARLVFRLRGVGRRGAHRTVAITIRPRRAR